MICRHLFAALLFACVFVAPSFSTPALADEASHRKAVEDLLAVTQVDKAYNQMIDMMIDAQTKQLPPAVAAPFKDTVKNFYAKYMSWDAIKEDFMKVYMENFTEDELKQITAFYQTPVGQKTIKELPQMMQQGMQRAQQRLQAHMPELQQELTEIAKKGAASGGAAPATPGQP